MYGIFSSRTYDSLDPQDQSFIKDYEKFMTRTFELVIIFFIKRLPGQRQIDGLISVNFYHDIDRYLDRW